MGSASGTSRVAMAASSQVLGITGSNFCAQPAGVTLTTFVSAQANATRLLTEAARILTSRARLVNMILQRETGSIQLGEVWRAHPFAQGEKKLARTAAHEVGGFLCATPLLPLRNCSLPGGQHRD